MKVFILFPFILACCLIMNAIIVFLLELSLSDTPEDKHEAALLDNEFRFCIYWGFVCITLVELIARLT